MKIFFRLPSLIQMQALRAEITLLPDHGGELTKVDHVKNSTQTCISADSSRHFMCAGPDEKGTRSNTDLAGSSAGSHADPRVRAAAPDGA